MTSKVELAEQCAIYLTAYQYYIETKSKARLLDTTIFGEAFAKKFVEIVFGHEDLINLSLSNRNHPAIDLARADNSEAFQVTISGDSTKIEETLTTFVKHKYDQVYPRLTFIILGKKQLTYDSTKIIRSSGIMSFDPNVDIYDLKQLYDHLVILGDAKRFGALKQLLAEELSEKIQPLLSGYYQASENMQALFKAHDVLAKDAAAALQEHGIDRSTFSNPEKLNERVTAATLKYLGTQFAVNEEWISGDYDHIYANGPDYEPSTDWRRNLRSAYDVVRRLFDTSENVMLVIPIQVSIDDLLTVAEGPEGGDPSGEGEFHHAADGNYFLVAKDKNDFKTPRYRWILNEPLFYEKTRKGMYLLFLAAEIYNAVHDKHRLITIFTADHLAMRACQKGHMFLAELFYDGVWARNHRDYLNFRDSAVQIASAVPSKDIEGLQAQLDEFLGPKLLGSPQALHLPLKIQHLRSPTP